MDAEPRLELCCRRPRGAKARWEPLGPGGGEILPRVFVGGRGGARSCCSMKELSVFKQLKNQGDFGILGVRERGGDQAGGMRRAWASRMGLEFGCGTLNS